YSTEILSDKLVRMMRELSNYERIGCMKALNPLTKEQQKFLSIEYRLLWHAATGIFELNFYINAYESRDYGPADAQRKRENGASRNMTREQYYQKMLADREWAESFIIDMIGRIKDK